jgi:hypothetical protein
MARAARGLVGGQIYHVLNRGNGRANVFHETGDFAAFVNSISGAKSVGTRIARMNTDFKTRVKRGCKG